MSELKPRITENGIDYILIGDYYIPDLKLPEERRPIGKYGRMHREYLREVHPDRLNTLILTGELCSIWLGGLLSNIPGASVHTFRWGGVFLAVSNLGCSNLQQGYNQFRFLLFLVSIRSCSLPPV